MIALPIRPTARLAALALSLAVAGSRASAQGTSPAAAVPVPPSAPAAVPTPDPARSALARQLLELMRAGPTVLQGIEMAIPMQKAANPRIPDVFWTEFSARAKREVPKFVEQVVPVYANRFSKQELEQLVAFYDSPVGRHLAEQSAAISVELMRAGQLWGVGLGTETAKDLVARGAMLQ